MEKYKFIIIVISILIVGGCGSTSRPDYEKITSAELIGPHYVARNIKVHYDDNTKPYSLGLLKTEEIVGDERYYVTYNSFNSPTSPNYFQVDSIIFITDGDSISIGGSYLKSTTYSIGNRYIAESIEYNYEITKEQLREIASSKNVLVHSKLGKKIDKGKLLPESINRFKIFLEKFGDK